jgi:hypothetical protein
MGGSRSSCGSARHLGHMVALRRKRKQQLCVDYSKPPMLLCKALDNWPMWARHRADFGSRALTGSLRLFPQSRDRLEQVAIPPFPTRCGEEFDPT